MTGCVSRRFCELEADNNATRSNDGRADPWGGFWIGTMGKCHEAAAGAIYRWFAGELRRLYADITVSNAICFSPDRSCAYFADTRDGRIMRQELESEEGWPVGEPRVLIDVSCESFGADGMVIDSEGCLWNARWGDHRVARYAPNGVLRNDSRVSHSAGVMPGLRRRGFSHAVRDDCSDRPR